MRVPERCLADLRSGVTFFEGFLEADELAAAQEALWLHYPRPKVYFADPAAHARLATEHGPAKSADRGDPGTWAGLPPGPARPGGALPGLSRPAALRGVPVGQYAGAVDYDQRHHRDFVNHSLVVPKRPAGHADAELDPPVRRRR